MMFTHPIRLALTVLLTAGTLAFPVPKTDIALPTETLDVVYNANIFNFDAANTPYPTVHREHAIITELYKRGSYYMNGYPS
ncbi:hypothetical protein GGI15_002509 [Coemansia interrupta]|uniref:Uncharacterized protein n=1 Tax=Coemansia interrupta TaxID=1126814 RepID=A0A9W8HJ79_9FUNG|nr:hypothetical protein GGI15_002509 [Coemansia interrupta]